MFPQISPNIDTGLQHECLHRTWETNMTRIIGAAAFLTIALATYAASINPYETKPLQQTQQRDGQKIEHTGSVR
jgi:hypothetical protein